MKTTKTIIAGAVICAASVNVNASQNADTVKNINPSNVQFLEIGTESKTLESDGLLKNPVNPDEETTKVRVGSKTKHTDGGDSIISWFENLFTYEQKVAEKDRDFS